MPRRGGRKKKTRTHVPMTEEEIDAVPKSLVLRRTQMDKELRQLEEELRAMMAPFTAVKLRESLKCKMKEILATAANFGVRHLLLFYQRGARVYLKCAVSPQGPTFTFALRSFHLGCDLVERLGRKSIGALGLGAAFPVVRGFEQHGSPRAGELAARLLRGLFPPQAHFQRARPRRVAVFAYDAATDLVEVRNYKVSQEVVGVSSAVKQILSGADFDFSAFDDAGELFAPEEQPGGERKVRLGLDEIAPRLSLQLVKIEEGLLAGEVLFHALVRKSGEEAGALRRRAAERAQTRSRNIRVQEENVARKQREAEARREAKRAKYPKAAPPPAGEAAPDFAEEASDTENAAIIRAGAKSLSARKKIRKLA